MKHRYRSERQKHLMVILKIREELLIDLAKINDMRNDEFRRMPTKLIICGMTDFTFEIPARAMKVVLWFLEKTLEKETKRKIGVWREKAKIEMEELKRELEE